MSFSLSRFLSFGLTTLYLSKLVTAVVFVPTPTVSKPSRLGIQAVLEPTERCQAKSHVLELRQDASRATCGWVDGNTANPVTCGASLYCATTSTFIGCCESSSCIGIFTTCYDLLGAACNAACQNNPQNLVCPTTLPYCALYKYEHGSVGYGCAQYSGYTSTVLLNPVTTAFGTLTGINMSTTSTTSSTTASPSPSPSSNGLKPAATAGIIIGSIAVIVAFGALIFLFWSYRRRNPRIARQSYIGSTTSSTTLRHSGDYSGTKHVFPSPKPPPWEWNSYIGPVEMPAGSAAIHELHAISR